MSRLGRCRDLGTDLRSELLVEMIRTRRPCRHRHRSVSLARSERRLHRFRSSASSGYFGACREGIQSSAAQVPVGLESPTYVSILVRANQDLLTSTINLLTATSCSLTSTRSWWRQLGSVDDNKRPVGGSSELVDGNSGLVDGNVERVAGNSGPVYANIKRVDGNSGLVDGNSECVGVNKILLTPTRNLLTAIANRLAATSNLLTATREVLAGPWTDGREIRLHGSAIGAAWPVTASLSSPPASTLTTSRRQRRP